MNFSILKQSRPAQTASSPLAVDPAEEIEFTDSQVMAIDVGDGSDPLQSDVEQAVVLFANGHDQAARQLLEHFVDAYPEPDGIRFWYLLFDLLQLQQARDAFDQLGLRFAERFELSPPSWSTVAPPPKAPAANQRSVLLQGLLTSDQPQAMDTLALALAGPVPVLIDCGRVIGCDDEMAGLWAALLRTARRQGKAPRLSGIEGFLERLDKRLVTGTPANEPAWCLLLELLQYRGVEAAFDARALDYAVTFEKSPPSWETPPVPVAVAVAAHPPAHFELSGEIRNARFADLAAYLAEARTPLIDCAGLRRLDFFSAGQLVNCVAPLHAAGKEVLFRSPNHLVAELMAVVGLNKLARIIVPKS